MPFLMKISHAFEEGSDGGLFETAQCAGKIRGRQQHGQTSYCISLENVSEVAQRLKCRYSVVAAAHPRHCNLLIIC